MKKIISSFTGQNKYRILLAVGYILLLSPFVYSVYYSMPANDDFAWALEWWSSNRLVEALHRVGWNYMNFFGQSGAFAIIIQILFNPLYWFNNAGHSFGICMVIVYLLIAIGMVMGLNSLVRNLSHIRVHSIVEIISFLIMCILYTCYYYSDVYNWWSGVPGYSLMMMVEIFTLNAIAAHQTKPDNKSYIGMIVLGIISCSGMMYCVTTGIFYFIYVFVLHYKQGDRLIKKIVPLVLFVISGIITIVAPGNFNRMSDTGAVHVSLRDSVIVTVIRVILRIRATVISKPWLIIFLFVIFMLGIKYRTDIRIKLWQLILGAIAIMTSVFGAMLPYVYGSNKALDSEFISRALYIEDYITFIGAAFWFLMFGMYIGHVLEEYNPLIIGTSVLAVATGMVVIACSFYGVVHGYWSQLLQYDMIQKADLIKESYYFWDDILDEIDSAEDGSDVVIDRVDVSWCQYVYDTSLDEEYKEPVSEDYKYGNCNQCASLYYGVRSIIVNLE